MLKIKWDWTPEADAYLAAKWMEGATLAEIKAAFEEDIPLYSVRHRIKKLGLPKRTTWVIHHGRNGA